MDTYKLTKEEQDQIFRSLIPEQREFITNGVKRGKKTKFAQVMAKDKGHVLPDNATMEQLERLLDDWVLIDFIDEGESWREISTSYCECGLKLRYQYVVQHKQTEETRRFGETHFKEHTGFDHKLVAEIQKGFREIDYEREEILYKVRYGWDSHILSEIPETLEIPNDILLFIQNKIPLLDKQYIRLKERINKHQSERRFIFTPPEPQHLSSVLDETSQQEELFSEEVEVQVLTKEVEVINTSSNTNLDIAFTYLQQGISSTRLICELLIKEHSFERKRMSSGKPYFYVDILDYFLRLEREGVIKKLVVYGQDDVEFQIV